MSSRPHPSAESPTAAEGCRYLLVAHDAPPTPGLCRLMAERCGRGPCEIHVLVSRFRRTVLVPDPAVGSPDEATKSIKVHDQEWDVAEARLDSFMRALGDLGQPLAGEILDGNLLRKVRQLHRTQAFDEILVLTGRRPSRWPGRDLTARIERSVRVPVTSVELGAIAA